MATNEAIGAETARSQRAQLGLGVAPLADLAGLVADMTPLDLVVMVMPQGMDAMLAVDVDTERPRGFLAVATTESPYRQRFSIAHELGHCALHSISTELPCTLSGGSRRTPEEVAADSFARNFLVPIRALAELLGQRKNPLETLSDAVRLFGVSPSVAAIQLVAAGMDESLKDRARATSAPQLATRYGWRDEYDALAQSSQRPRAPRQLLDDAITAYAQGRIGIGIVARVAGRSLDEERALLEDSGIRPDTPGTNWFTFDEGH